MAVVASLAATVVVTELLATRAWPSLFVGIPADASAAILVGGAAYVALTRRSAT